MSTSVPPPGPVPGPRPGVPGPSGPSSPRPAPPTGHVTGSAANQEPLPELPDDDALAAMTIREHVTLFEELHRTLADRLDDAGS